MTRGLSTRRGFLPEASFLPDGTRAVVRSLDSNDLKAVHIQGLVTNALHLSTHPGSTVIQKLGGLHDFMAWDRPIITDSGGFQIYSLLRENSRNGSVTDKGFMYRPGGQGDKKLLSPAKAIQHQVRYGADIVFCLDQCTHPSDALEIQKQSVARTIAWAKACKEEFDRLTRPSKKDTPRPLLFAVVQGGDDKDLRRRCADALLEIGFDGYGFGGWPIAEDGGLTEMVGFVGQDLVPDEFPLHALGVGKPENIVAAFDQGYLTFDSALPTRDARRQRLFVPTMPLTPENVRKPKFYRYIYLKDEKWRRHKGPVDESCDCPCCTQVSAAYLHHLFKIEDVLAYRLATLHNLRFITRLTACLQSEAST
ncbi:MAG: tRNA guanosine(34) transglycosylase Tgt [Myxococcota bacterium]